MSNCSIDVSQSNSFLISSLWDNFSPPLTPRVSFFVILLARLGSKKLKDFPSDKYFRKLWFLLSTHRNWGASAQRGRRRIGNFCVFSRVTTHNTQTLRAIHPLQDSAGFYGSMKPICRLNKALHSPSGGGFNKLLGLKSPWPTLRVHRVNVKKTSIL